MRSCKLVYNKQWELLIEKESNDFTVSGNVTELVRSDKCFVNVSTFCSGMYSFIHDRSGNLSCISLYF